MVWGSSNVRLSTLPSSPVPLNLTMLAVTGWLDTSLVERFLLICQVSTSSGQPSCHRGGAASASLLIRT